jgi:signal transduction histidine kinase
MVFRHDEIDFARFHTGAAPVTPPLSAKNDNEPFIRRELLGFVLGHTRTAVLGNLGVALVTITVLTVSQPSPLLALWAIGFGLLLSIRVVVSMRMKSRLERLDLHGIERSERTLTVLIGLNGLTWGLLTGIGFNGHDPFVDFYTVSMLVGMTGGGTPSLSAIPRVLRVYLCAALIPFIVRALLIGSTASLAGGITVAFALLVLWSFGGSAHRALRENLRLSNQNAQLAEALRSERDAVRAIMRAKDLFQAGVTHDLRQPVHALALHLRYLRSLGPDEWAPGRMDESWGAVETALHLISTQLTRLLDLSRLESGEVRPVIGRVRVDDLLRSCRAKFAPLAAAKGLELRLRATRCAVRSDARMLQSIIDNFVSNAIRYTDAGGVLVGVRTHSQRAEIQVFDTGPGIDPDIVPQLFVAYRRFDDRTRDREEGHGLGLALAQKQADLLGHELTVRSIPGRGSMFGVSLPPAMKIESPAPPSE